MKKENRVEKKLLCVGLNHYLSANNLIWAVVLMFGTLFLTACGDDDSTPDVKSVKDVDGTYYGNVIVEVPETPKSGKGILKDVYDMPPLNAFLGNDTILFGNFPIVDLIYTMVGEALAPGIIEKIGVVKYKIGYNASFSDDFTQIKLNLNPKLLVIDVPYDPLSSFYLAKIEVEFETSAEAYYDYEKQGLYIQLKVKNVRTEPEGSHNYPSKFTFEMKKVDDDLMINY